MSALAVLNAACQPLAESAVLKELGAVKALTKARDAGESGTEFQLRVYARKLKDYPADAVRLALRDWPDHSTWWPSWHELKTGLDDLAGDRLMKRAALQSAVDEIMARAAKRDASHG